MEEILKEMLGELRAIKRLLTAPVLTINAHWMDEDGFKKSIKSREVFSSGKNDTPESDGPDCKDCMEAWDNKPPCSECWWLNARKGVRDAISPVVSS